MKTQTAKNVLPPEIDAVNVGIFSGVQADANVKLATRVHLSPSPCLTRIRSLADAP
jgi:DNA-binding Lrp family transcriptional regulator